MDLFTRLNALRHLLGERQIAVGISGLDASLDADFAITKRLRDFCDDLADTQPTGWVGGIDSLNLRCALDAAIAEPALFAGDPL